MGASFPSRRVLEGGCLSILLVLDIDEIGNPATITRLLLMGSVTALAIGSDGGLEDFTSPERFHVGAVAVIANSTLAWHIQRQDAEITSFLTINIVSTAVCIEHRSFVDITLVIEDGSNCSGFVGNGPGELRNSLLTQKISKPSANGGDDLEDTSGLTVLSVRSHDEMLGLGHLVPPVVSIIRLLELVQNSIYHQFRHSKPLSIKERVNFFLQHSHLRGVQAGHDVHFIVIIQSP
mmetsp:Transcript_28602/g.53220  ORF Transcript_28602/g.53220 Transcript_28602/m.53220 type:complete len:235 (+) Transcript_28602:304-1008(+)